MSPPTKPCLFHPFSETFHNHLHLEISPTLSRELQLLALSNTILDGSSDNSTRRLQNDTLSNLSRLTRNRLNCKHEK
jgi:hypothetical protein